MVVGTGGQLLGQPPALSGEPLEHMYTSPSPEWLSVCEIVFYNCQEKKLLKEVNRGFNEYGGIMLPCSKLKF